MMMHADDLIWPTQLISETISCEVLWTFWSLVAGLAGVVQLGLGCPAEVTTLKLLLVMGSWLPELMGLRNASFILHKPVVLL